MSDRKSQAFAAGLFDDGDFPAAALEHANAAILRLKEMYAAEWAPAALAEIYDELAAAQRDRLDRGSRIDRIYRIAHDMKGQGGTFDFPILTEIGESLCRITAARQDASEGELVMIRAHADMARRVIEERIDGDGGEAGARLLAELQAVIRRHSH